MTVLAAIFGLSQAWSSINPVTLVQSWRKFLPDLEYGLQGFPNKEISKSKILDMVCAMKSCENVYVSDAEEWLQSNVCERVFQHMTVNIADATKQKEELGEKDESEK
jgi:hypothetical protein